MVPSVRENSSLRRAKLLPKCARTRGLGIVFGMAACSIFAAITMGSRRGVLWQHCDAPNDQRLFRYSLRQLTGPPKASRWITIANRSLYLDPNIQEPFSSVSDGMQNAIEEVASEAAKVARSAACPSGIASIGRVYWRPSKTIDFFVVAGDVECDGEERQAYIVYMSIDENKKCSISYSRTNDRQRLTIVVPYYGRKQALDAFLRRFASGLRRPSYENVSLLIAAPGNESKIASSVISELGIDHSARVVETGTDAVGNFSRSVALRDAISTLDRDDLIAIVDVDLRIGDGFFKSCRENTVQGHQVWFPVVFAAFPNSTSVTAGEGVWYTGGYGMACIYHSDFDAVGGFGESPQKEYFGWGREDVGFVQRMRKLSGYTLFRSYEPDLFHVWHKRNCGRNRSSKQCRRIATRQSGDNRN